jgi:hypothetical protein
LRSRASRPGADVVARYDLAQSSVNITGW